MVGGHHQLNGHESEQTLGDSEGQGSLVCHSPWGHKESDTTEQLNNNRISILWGPHPREKGATEDAMVGWHHPLNGHEFEQTLGDSEEQGSLVCCSPWGCRESDTT